MISDLLWPVAIYGGGTFWFRGSELQKLRQPEEVDLQKATAYKCNLKAYRDPCGQQGVVLHGAWVARLGEIVCDVVREIEVGV